MHIRGSRKKESGFGLIGLLIIVVIVIIVIVTGGLNNSNSSQTSNTEETTAQETTTNSLSKVGQEESGTAFSQSALSELQQSYLSGNSLSQGFAAAETFEPALSSQAYLDQVFTTAENPMSKLYLPNYAYSQSLVYAQNDVNIFGQVRILGGVVSGGRTQLGYGAMITAVPQYVTRRTTPTQPRYHITEWKEL